MEKFDNELLEKAKQAKSVEELLELAKANSMPMTEDEAKIAYARLHPTSGEVEDDELDNVSGGGCGQQQQYDYPPDGTTVTCKSRMCPMCGSMEGIFHRLGFRNQWYVACKNGCQSSQLGDVIECGYLHDDPKDKLVF